MHSTGRLTDSSRSAGRVASRHRESVDRNSGLPRLPCRARDAALVFLAVGNQRQPRQHAGGQGTDRLANRRFQIGRAPIAAPKSAAASTASGPPSRSAMRVERANGITRSALPPRASSSSDATFEARSRSRGVTLADVSTSTPTATFAGRNAQARLRQRQQDQSERRDFQRQAQLARRAPVFEVSPGERNPSERQHPSCGRKS